MTIPQGHCQNAACMQEHVEAGLGGRPEVGVRGLLQLADEEPQARLTLEAQEAARAAFSPTEECRESMLNLRCPSSLHNKPTCPPTSLSRQLSPRILHVVSLSGVSQHMHSGLVILPKAACVENRAQNHLLDHLKGSTPIYTSMTFPFRPTKL